MDNYLNKDLVDLTNEYLNEQHELKRELVHQINTALSATKAHLRKMGYDYDNQTEHMKHKAFRKMCIGSFTLRAIKNKTRHDYLQLNINYPNDTMYS